MARRRGLPALADQGSLHRGDEKMSETAWNEDIRQARRTAARAAIRQGFLPGSPEYRNAYLAVYDPLAKRANIVAVAQSVARRNLQKLWEG